ncbi:enoyl-CoA hydratase-related protein, partial [Enterococcus casseliflavus]|uniref:enoyl-CoA hydratase-related protein n=1 Tax=Enterococcus casseliflavus TaxID=37734 RepID=UPI003D0D9209
MKFDTLLVDIADGIATITLNRPNKKNAMNPALHRDMTSALDQLRYEPTARVVL